MSGRTKRVELDDAVPGMVLAVPLLDRHGAILLPESTILNADALRSLERRGIDEVIVADTDVSERELEAERQRTQARLERLFRRSANAGGCAALRRAVTVYRLGSER